MAVIWVDVLNSDDADAAQRATVLIADERVSWFHDPGQWAAREWAETLGLKDLAWDVYLLFDAEARWNDAAPTPFQWFHQLGGERADASNFRAAHSLAIALHETGAAAGWPVPDMAPDKESWQSAREEAMRRLQAAGSASDERCSDCRETGRLSSCSLGGWRRLLMRMEDETRFTASGTQPPSPADGRQELQLSIQGMRCAECMLRVGSGIVSVEGVAELELLLDEAKLRVLLMPGSTTSVEDLAEAIRAQGFGVRP